MRAIMFSSDRGDLPFQLALTNNFAATTNPGVGNDISQGYEPGSTWINTLTKTAYICLSNALGAAVWQPDSLQAGQVAQAAPATQDTAATLTAAQLAAGIITTNPGGAVNLQLPLATGMDTQFPNYANDTAFDFSVINIAGAANTATITTNTGWALVGSMAVAQNVSARFRARKTGTGAWTLYRLA